MIFARNSRRNAARPAARARLAALLLAAVCVGGCEPPATSRPSFVLISLDATRADHLGAYGYERDTTPYIDSMARRGYVFEQAVAPSLNTLISHASLLTGLPGWAHGATWSGGGQPLHPAFTTVAEELAGHGYRTAAFAAHGDWLNPEMGIAQGFATFSSDYRPAEAVLGEAAGWLKDLPGDEPFFLFVHLYDVHSDYEGRPYGAPEPFLGTWAEPGWDRQPDGSDFLSAVNDGEVEITREEAARLADQYDEGLAYVDDRLRLFYESAAAGRLAGAWTIVVADHGEAFLEHGKLMHVTLHDEVVRVPFIVVPPAASELADRVPARIDRQVRLVDVRATVNALAGLPAPRDSMGVDLTPCLRAPDQERSCPSRPATLFRGGLRHDGFKLIRIPSGAELYDLRYDPGETVDVAGRHDAWRRQRGMQRMLRRLIEEQEALRERVVAGREVAPPSPDPEAAERLRALGYLE